MKKRVNVVNSVDSQHCFIIDAKFGFLSCAMRPVLVDAWNCVSSHLKPEDGITGLEIALSLAISAKEQPAVLRRNVDTLFEHYPLCGSGDSAATVPERAPSAMSRVSC